MDLVDLKTSLMRMVVEINLASDEASKLPMDLRPSYRRSLRLAQNDVRKAMQLVDEAANAEMESLDCPTGPFVGLADNQDDLIPEIPPHNGEGKEGDHGPL